MSYETQPAYMFYFPENIPVSTKYYFHFPPPGSYISKRLPAAAAFYN